MQYGGFPWKIHAKNLCVNFYTSFYTQTFYTQIWVCFYGDWFCLWQYTVHTVYFFTTANVADVKLETNIVEKRLFAVKEKTTYYTLTLTMIMLRSRTSCFVINDFLGRWQKHYFTCKLGCMFILYLPWLLFWNKFNVLACIAGTWTSVHCFFFLQTCLYWIHT